MRCDGSLSKGILLNAFLCLLLQGLIQYID